MDESNNSVSADIDYKVRTHADERVGADARIVTDDRRRLHEPRTKVETRTNPRLCMWNPMRTASVLWAGWASVLGLEADMKGVPTSSIHTPITRISYWVATLITICALSAHPISHDSAADSDNDDVPDSHDSCIGHIPGTTGIDRHGCPTQMDNIYAELSFDHNDHKQWYERFWEGDCEGLSFVQSFVCVRDDNHWYRIIHDILPRVSPVTLQPEVRFNLWQLGRVVGHEWARDNNTRLIDTNDVQRWYEELRTSTNIAQTVEEIWSAAWDRLH